MRTPEATKARKRIEVSGIRKAHEKGGSMKDLNYHHLHYFWAVAHAGTVTRAARELGLVAPTVSAQIKLLEAAIGKPLFEKAGRKLALTAMGRTVLRYADEIFRTGNELRNAVAQSGSAETPRLSVGIVDAVPKLVAERLLRPVTGLTPRVAITARQGTHRALLTALAMHEIDLVIADAPSDENVAVKVFNHPLGRCGLTLFGSARFAKLKPGFPKSLDGQPLLMPGDGSAPRAALERWMAKHGLSPDTVAEIDDSGLLKTMGQRGLGVFAMPTAIEEEVVRQYEVTVLGRADDVEVAYYATSADRRLKHPAVLALVTRARGDLFG